MFLETKMGIYRKLNTKDTLYQALTSLQENYGFSEVEIGKVFVGAVCSLSASQKNLVSHLTSPSDSGLKKWRSRAINLITSLEKELEEQLISELHRAEAEQRLGGKSKEEVLGQFYEPRLLEYVAQHFSDCDQNSLEGALSHKLNHPSFRQLTQEGILYRIGSAVLKAVDTHQDKKRKKRHPPQFRYGQSFLYKTICQELNQI